MKFDLLLGNLHKIETNLESATSFMEASISIIYVTGKKLGIVDEFVPFDTESSLITV